MEISDDYHILNSITKSDKYPILDINSIVYKLADKTRLNKINLVSSYYQIKMHPDDKTTLFQWNFHSPNKGFSHTVNDI